MNSERKDERPRQQTPIKDLMRLDKQLKALLRENDITVAQLARASSVSAKTIYNWLAGQKPRDLDAVKRISDHFQVSIEFICYGQTSPKNVGEFERHLNEIRAGTFEVILKPIRK